MNQSNHGTGTDRRSLTIAARGLGAMALVAALGLGAGLGGCNSIQTVDGTKIRKNLPATRVVGKYGPPDICADRELGETRWYFIEDEPAPDPEAKIPPERQTAYYYVNRGYKLLINEGKVRGSDSITEQETDEILPRVHERKAKRAEAER
jgi:hypothetical protein